MINRQDILVVSLLHKNYDLLDQAIKPLSERLDCIIIDNTPPEFRKPIPYPTLYVDKKYSSYGYATYLASKYISLDNYKYVLWVNQDIEFAEDVDSVIDRFINTINEDESIGLLTCGLSGSQMEAYNITFGGGRLVDGVTTYGLTDKDGMCQFAFFETQFILIEKEVFKKWAKKIEVCDTGVQTEFDLVAYTYASPYNKWKVITDILLHHDRNRTIDKDNTYYNRIYKDSVDNIKNFLCDKDRYKFFTELNIDWYATGNYVHLYNGAMNCIDDLRRGTYNGIPYSQYGSFNS